MSSSTISVGLLDGQFLKNLFEAVRDRLGWSGVEYDEELHKAVTTGVTDDAINGPGGSELGTVDAVVDGHRYVVAPPLLVRIGQWVTRKSMGGYPEARKTSMVHLNKEMCELLFQADVVPPDVVSLPQLSAWDVRVVRGGGKCAKVLSDLYVNHGSSHQTCADGHNARFSSVDGVLLEGNVLVTLLINPVVKWEIMVGAARVIEPSGDFTHFGLCLPAEYVSKLVFRSRGAGLFSAFIQTQVPDKRLGKLVDHKNVEANAPRVSFTGVVAPVIDAQRVPNAAGIYSVASAGPAQACVELLDVQFAGVAHFSVLSPVALSFVVLIPGGFAGMQRYVALMPGAAVVDAQGTYNYMLESRLCAAWDGVHTTPMVRSDVTPEDTVAAKAFAGNVRVHTIEREVFTSYTGHYAGTYANVPGVGLKAFPVGRRTALSVAYL